MVKRLCTWLMLAVSLSAQAGYYATVTTGNGGIWKASSDCYLTPGMAINSLTGYQPVNVSAIDTTAKTWSAYFYNMDYSAVGTYGTCDAVPLGGSMPVFMGGLTDPAITPTGISGGSSGGSTMDLITNSADAETIAGAFLLLFAVAFGFKMIRQSIQVADLGSDEKH